MIRRLLTVVLVVILLKLGWFLIDTVEPTRTVVTDVVKQLHGIAEPHLEHLAEKPPGQVRKPGEQSSLFKEFESIRADTLAQDEVSKAHDRFRRILERERKR